MANLSWPPSSRTESDSTDQQPVDPLACAAESSPYTTVEPPAPPFASSSTSTQASNLVVLGPGLTKHQVHGINFEFGRKATNKSSL